MIDYCYNLKGKIIIFKIKSMRPNPNPIVFSSNSINKIFGDNGSSEMKRFNLFTLPTRLNISEIQNKVNNPEFVSKKRIFYLISHLTDSGEKVVTYIVWDDTPGVHGWHFSTEEYNQESKCKWNSGIKYLYD